MSKPINVQTLRYNVTMNLMDGAFFGLALGFASFTTIIPLFVSTMTSSAILIGLIPAIHAVGWQLPQLFTARAISRMTRFKPMVLWMTIQERLPFLGLALVAWFLPAIGNSAALVLTFALLIWQGLGAGMAANPWQNLIAKIIPNNMRGTFLGGQSSVANALASISAIGAGIILERMEHPLDYVVCFIIASIALVISWFFLAQTREDDSEITQSKDVKSNFWGDVRNIVRTQPEFRKFLLIRSLLAFASLAFAFYAVYAVHVHKVSEGTIGIMTGVLMGTQIAANPIMGWLGDRFGHRSVMEGGVIACILSALIAWWAPHPNWFYGVFVLTGIGNVAVWTTGLAMTLEFGGEQDRPAYIGLANTLVAPSTILAPLIGGWIADQAGYPFTFALSILCGLITLIILFWMRWIEKNPKSFPHGRASTG